MGNNPINAVDPTGMDSINVNNSGLVAGVYKNDGNNRFFDSNGNELKLNDPNEVDNDYLTSAFAKGDRLFHSVSRDQVIEQVNSVPHNTFITLSLKMGNFTDAYIMAIKNSYGKADFAVGFLQNFGDIRQQEDGIFRPDFDPIQSLFKFEGSEGLYNTSDAGNFMWGAWTKHVGFSNAQVKIGSHLNEVRQGRAGDSAADQRAIFTGRSWYKK